MNIVKMKKIGLNIYLLKYGIEGMSFQFNNDEEMVYDAENDQVMTKDGNCCFDVFDAIQVHVQVKKVDSYDERLVMRVVLPT